MDDEKREVCEGCKSGNYWLCKSFPGTATEHVKREEAYRKRRAQRRKERAGDRPPAQARVFHRDAVVE